MHPGTLHLALFHSIQFNIVMQLTYNNAEKTLTIRRAPISKNMATVEKENSLLTERKLRTRLKDGRCGSLLPCFLFMLLRYPTLDLHRLWAILHLKPHFHFQVPLHLEAHTDGHTFQCKLRIVKIIIWYHYYYLVLHEIILLWKNTQLSKSSTKVPLIAQRKTEFLIRQSKKKQN